MKCTHCGSEWTIAKGLSAPSNCPFCGKPLKPQNNTMEDTLKYIAGTYGADILRDGRKLASYFADIAPELRREHKLLGYLAQCDGNVRLIDALSLSDTGQRQEWLRLTQYMKDDMCLDGNAVTFVCESFWNEASGGKVPVPVLTQTPSQLQTQNINQPPKVQPQPLAKPRPPVKPASPKSVGTITIAGKNIQTDVTELDLFGCTINITKSDVNKLRRTLPKCKIRF